MAIESVLKEGSSVRIHMPSTAIHEIKLIGKYHVILLASLPAFSSEMMIATPPPLGSWTVGNLKRMV